MDYVKGVAQGVNSFVNHAYYAIVATLKDPLSPVAAAVKMADEGVKAYETSAGRKALAAQFSALSTQDKVATVTEALMLGGLGAKANAKPGASAPAQNVPSETGAGTAGQVLSEGTIYRAGGSNPANLTPRSAEAALSFRDSLSDPIGPGTQPVFTKDNYIGVDVSKLPEGSAVLDNNPQGHVSVDASPEAVKSAITKKGKFPDDDK